MSGWPWHQEAPKGSCGIRYERLGSDDADSSDDHADANNLEKLRKAAKRGATKRAEWDATDEAAEFPGRYAEIDYKSQEWWSYDRMKHEFLPHCSCGRSMEVVLVARTINPTAQLQPVSFYRKFKRWIAWYMQSPLIRFGGSVLDIVGAAGDYYDIATDFLYAYFTMPRVSVTIATGLYATAIMGVIIDAGSHILRCFNILYVRGIPVGTYKGVLGLACEDLPQVIFVILAEQNLWDQLDFDKFVKMLHLISRAGCGESGPLMAAMKQPHYVLMVNLTGTAVGMYVKLLNAIRKLGTAGMVAALVLSAPAWIAGIVLPLEVAFSMLLGALVLLAGALVLLAGSIFLLLAVVVLLVSGLRGVCLVVTEPEILYECVVATPVILYDCVTILCSCVVETPATLAKAFEIFCKGFGLAIATFPVALPLGVLVALAITAWAMLVNWLSVELGI